MLGHKRSLNQFKKMEITSNIFSNYHGMKTKNQLWKKNWKIQKYVEMKQPLLNNQWVKEIKPEIKNIFKMET